MSDADLRSRIKDMMVKNLMLQITADQIQDDAPLFGPNGIGLDSIDALELAVAWKKTSAQACLILKLQPKCSAT